MAASRVAYGVARGIALGMARGVVLGMARGVVQATALRATALRATALVALVAASSLAMPAWADSRLVVKGGSKALRKNVELTLGPPPNVSSLDARALRRYVEDAPQRAKTGMAALGYYDGEVAVERTIDDAPKKKDKQDKKDKDKDKDNKKEKQDKSSDGETNTREASADSEAVGTGSDDDTEGTGADASAKETPSLDIVVTVTLTPNQPVLIKSSDIKLTGEGEKDPIFRRTISEIPLKVGDVFISRHYEAAKSALFSRAQQLGYFNFEFADSEVRVSRRAHTADIRLVGNTGTRFLFGPVLFSSNRFGTTFLERWMPFKEGDPYKASFVGEFTQNLQNSGYFKSVRVTPQRDPRYGTTVPIRVDVIEHAKNKMSIGIGYATDTDFRSRVTWKRPVINRAGHSATAEFGFSRDTQDFSVGYRIPRSNEPLYNYWNFSYGLKNDTEIEAESFLSSLVFERVSRTRSQWTESLFFRWDRETYTISGEEDTTDLYMPGVNYTRSRSKGSPFLTWGQSENFLLMGGREALGSSIDILKGQVAFKALRALGNRHTFIGTLQYGAIKASDYERVPTSQRFFAGGDRSIRGFAYRSVSPKDAEGSPVGGRYLEAVNLEYNYRFYDRWSGAVFVDGGRAFNDFDEPYAVGAGIGVRWQSPVGPFRLDLARPVSDNDGSGLRIHLSLGPDL